MKMVTIAVAKIRPEIYELIESGVKRFEVRGGQGFDWPSDDFGIDTDAILGIDYVDSETGEELGLWRAMLVNDNDYYFAATLKNGELNDSAELCLKRSAVDEETFRELFGLHNAGDQAFLYIAQILDKVNSPAELTTAGDSNE
jgi:hypothetical protein